jgi:hypothetical protein
MILCVSTKGDGRGGNRMRRRHTSPLRTRFTRLWRATLLGALGVWCLGRETNQRFLEGAILPEKNRTA